MKTNQRGSAALEFVGLIPVILLTAVIAIQFGIFGWAALSVSDAARAAARAAAMGQDPHLAAQAALPNGLEPVQVTGGQTGDGYSYTVTIKTPTVVPILDLGEISRSADMPSIK